MSLYVERVKERLLSDGTQQQQQQLRKRRYHIDKTDTMATTATHSFDGDSRLKVADLIGESGQRIHQKITPSSSCSSSVPSSSSSSLSSLSSSMTTSKSLRLLTSTEYALDTDTSSFETSSSSSCSSSCSSSSSCSNFSLSNSFCSTLSLLPICTTTNFPPQSGNLTISVHEAKAHAETSSKPPLPSPSPSPSSSLPSSSPSPETTHSTSAPSLSVSLTVPQIPVTLLSSYNNVSPLCFPLRKSSLSSLSSSSLSSILPSSSTLSSKTRWNSRRMLNRSETSYSSELRQSAPRYISAQVEEDKKQKNIQRMASRRRKRRGRSSAGSTWHFLRTWVGELPWASPSSSSSPLKKTTMTTTRTTLRGAEQKSRRGATLAALLLLLNVICSNSITAVTGEGNAPNNLTRGSTPTDFLNDLLDEHRYDSRLRPNFNGDPTNITINFFVASFGSINELSMEYTVDMYLRQTWVDPRLKHSYSKPLVLPPKFIDKIWIADLFFSNEKSSYFHDVTVPNRYIRIAADGEVLYSVRLTLTLACPMVLKSFPLDTQVCSVQLESYGYSTEDVIFQWAPEGPVQIAEDTELPQFNLMDTRTSICTKVYSTGAFTCLQVSFTLQREFGFYLLQTYVPSSLIVVLSWVSFWISSDAVPARISLGVTTVLTVTTQLSASQQSVPRVSYTKAIDVWMSACMMFVFSALMEFALVNVLSRKRPPQDHKSDPDEIEMMGLRGGKKKSKTPGGIRNLNQAIHRRLHARLVDKFSRIFFPASFFLFNFVYWLIYNPLR